MYLESALIPDAYIYCPRPFDVASSLWSRIVLSGHETVMLPSLRKFGQIVRHSQYTSIRATPHVSCHLTMLCYETRLRRRHVFLGQRL